MRGLLDKTISRAPPSQSTNGNLFEVSRNHSIDGGQRRRPTAALVAAGAVSLIGLALFAATRRQASWVRR